MHAIRSSLLFATLVANVTVFPTLARSDELLVMPYSCSVRGGEPVLTPSQDQGYRIVGTREQREFTTCSPMRPSHCRRWTLQRFNVDCAGTTVPWAALVAASNQHERAWLENDQLSIQMPWTWNLDFDDPCLQSDRFQRRRFSPRARFCERRRANARASVIRLPSGFAPTFGIDAIFVNAKSKQGSQIATRLDPTTPPLKKAQAQIQIPPPPAQNPKVEPSKPQKQHPAENQPNRPTLQVEQKEKKEPTTSPPVIVSKPAPAKSLANKNPNAPTIINAKPSQTTVAPTSPEKDKPDAVAQAESKTEPAKQPAKTPANTDTKKTVNLVVAGSRVPKESIQSSSDNNQSPSSARWQIASADHPIGQTLAWITALSISALLGWALIRRQNTLAPSSIGHDIASVSMGANQNTPHNTKREVAILEKTTQTHADPQSNETQPPTATTTTPGPDGAIPKSLPEAFKILGMSDTSHASPTAIKKVVDGLRSSWHPDHAADEADRQIRESRLKQINAAWEIISKTQNTETKPTPLVPSDPPLS